MSKKMLIDAAHLEETRVVVVNGSRIEEFDFEAAAKKPLKGNIYLAKVTRVEPSLQAAFVNFGGNRHGFLAFNEIHPDYYQIPIADRQRLMAQEKAVETASTDDETGPEDQPAQDDLDGAGASGPIAQEGEPLNDGAALHPSDETGRGLMLSEGPRNDERSLPSPDVPGWGDDPEAVNSDFAPVQTPDSEQDVDANDPPEPRGAEIIEVMSEAAPPVQTGGAGDDLDDALEEARGRRFQPQGRPYKIHEVIKRHQILLVQVVKEERGTKGAALTTYLSLAGRYCVLMPNTARGGGISRKITNQADRKRLKSAVSELEIPSGIGLIIRTAGANRTKAEIKRDYEYLLRVWESVRDLTLQSTAPALVYEEGNLIKRAIRDLYTKEIDAILVDGDEGYKDAKAFMRTLMPSHAKTVQPYNDRIPLFQRFQVETLLDQMFQPTVHLRSGGYIVINQTEALVSIDVNSGRATREHSIEETALRTNLEAADEVARQLRLRDLAGLIVIDFIDMEEGRNNRAVEKRIKDALKSDRARIQVGRISSFGLLEMSRQRLRAGVLEGSTNRCPHCEGSGIIRSVESAALRALRALEEEGLRDRTAVMTLKVPQNVALYILNHKRSDILEIEQRYAVNCLIEADEDLPASGLALERTETKEPGQSRAPEPQAIRFEALSDSTDDDIEESDDELADEDDEPSDHDDDKAEAPAQASSESAEDSLRRKKRRRRRRGRRNDEFRAETPRPDAPLAQTGEPRESSDDESEAHDDFEDDDQPSINGESFPGQSEADSNSEHAERNRRRRRRGRRGGRRNRERPDRDLPKSADPMSENVLDLQDGGEPAEPLTHSQGFEITIVEAPSAPNPVPASPIEYAAPGYSRTQAPEPFETNYAQPSTQPLAEPPVQPVAAAPEPERPAHPPRRGWWQRRFGGN